MVVVGAGEVLGKEEEKELDYESPVNYLKRKPAMGDEFRGNKAVKEP